jgi:hypothetical protein
MGILAVVLLTLLVSLPARAAEVTRVVSALDDENAFDFNLTAFWLHEYSTGFIKRESEDPPANLVKDLKYAQTVDILNLRLDFGVLWDIGLHVNLPIVLRDTTSLDFDRSEGSSCIYPERAYGAQPTCVDSANATLLRDGILPGYGMNSWGLDSRNNTQYSRPPQPATGPFDPGTASVFQGPKRRGIPFVGVGVVWAAMNQLRDDTKPTWTLGFDAQLDVFKDMRFDPTNPGANTAVGLGYHQLIWSTWISKRFRRFDPYFGAYYMLPIRTNGSLFQNYPGDTQTTVSPQMQAGFTVGVEQVAWENVPAKQRVTVEARFRVQEHFYGRGYSPLWQPLSGSSSCAASGTAPECRPGIDGNIGGTGLMSPYPGITEIESYATFGGDLGLNVQVGKLVRFRGLFGLSTDMPHYITGASTGVDKDGSGQVNSQSSEEANPLYRESIDLPGRRFRVEGSKIWTLFLEGSIMF